MNRFKAPSSSEASFPSPLDLTTSPATHEPKKVLNKGKAGIAQHRIRPGAEPDITDLLMKKARRERIQVKHRTGSHVYVGNLSQKATEVELAALFSTCGEIEDVSIRHSSHCTERLIDVEDEMSNGDHYASVRFVGRTDSRKALLKNGTLLHGSRLLVCLAVMDLPEVSRMAERGRQLLERKGEIFTPGITLQATVVINSPSSYPVEERPAVRQACLERGNIMSTIEASGGISEWLR